MLPLDEVPKLRADDAAAEALAELNDGVGRGLVLEDGDRLAGLLSITDVMRALEVAPSAPNTAATTVSRERRSARFGIADPERTLAPLGRR